MTAESDGPYTQDVIPFPDSSARWFEEAMIQCSPLSPSRVRAIVRQTVRDLRNACQKDEP